MTLKVLNISQFLFPILAILCLTSGLFGAITIQITLCLILIGFCYSIYLVTVKKLILWGMINILLTILIIVGGAFIFFSLVYSGV
ncbi:MAG: hypothetical protein ACO1OT_05045 [Heyndrickxia sp.]